MHGRGTGFPPHSGRTARKRVGSYTRLAVIYFYVASNCYMIVLNEVIEEFKLTAADEKINNRMRYAQLMAIADTDDQVQQIAWQLLG